MSGSVHRRKRPGDEPGKPTGPWLARFQAIDGRRYGKSFPTKAEARKWLATQEADTLRGSWARPSKATVADALDDWWQAELIPQHEAGDIRDHTVREYRRFVKTIKANIGRVQLTNLDAAVIEDALIRPLLADYASSTVRQMTVPLRSALVRAIRRKLIVASPFDTLDKRVWKGGRPAPIRQKTLTPTQVARLVEHAEEGRPEVLIALVAGTGLRIGEALALRGQDIGTASVQVAQAAYAGKVDRPKTEAAKRVAPILPEFAWALDAMREMSMDKAPGSLLFTNARGGALISGNVADRWLIPAADRAGLGRIGWHVLRHSLATRLAEAGMQPALVQSALGHENPQTTLAYYTHVSSASVEDAFAALPPGA